MNSFNILCPFKEQKFPFFDRTKSGIKWTSGYRVDLKLEFHYFIVIWNWGMKACAYYLSGISSHNILPSSLQLMNLCLLFFLLYDKNIFRFLNMHNIPVLPCLHILCTWACSLYHLEFPTHFDGDRNHNLYFYDMFFQISHKLHTQNWDLNAMIRFHKDEKLRLYLITIILTFDSLW